MYICIYIHFYIIYYFLIFNNTSISQPCPIPMNWLMGWEYARIWLRERDDYISARLRKSKAKRIKNDYTAWLLKRQIKPKKIS